MKNVTIQRETLLKLAAQLSASKILYVQAPAGYGKTVFGGQWLAAQKSPSAILALDEYDNSLYDFCSKAKEALNLLFPHSASLQVFTNHPAFNTAPAEFLMRAAGALPKTGKACLMIDDLHFIDDPAVQKLLPVFLSRLAAGTSVLVLSRFEPPESFSGLLLKNELAVISQEHMHFNSEEIFTLYSGNGIKITKKQAQSIFQYTEGWPIEINALLLSGMNVPIARMPHNQLETFLKTQVWETLEERQRRFLLGTSFEVELSEPLCRALTGEADSVAVLEQLLSQGAFLLKQSGGTYRFHRLFRQFLHSQFQEQPPEYQTGQFRRAGEYYLAQNDFYRAIERFSKIRDVENIARSFDLLEQMDRAGFDSERVMMSVRQSLDEGMANEYPFLFFMMAFTARNDGRCEDFVRYADGYYANYPRIVQRNPELAHNIFFLYIMDYRYTFSDIVAMAGNAQSAPVFQEVRGSSTAYFPFYHRSFRDFSELACGDPAANVQALGGSLGALLGKEKEMLLECVMAGLCYEKGELPAAQNLALSAVAKIQNEFAAESKFCALMILLAVNHALRQEAEAAAVQADIRNMMEAEKAYCLQFNFESVVAKYRLAGGDAAAAKAWLQSYGTEMHEQLAFFRLCGNFTTARAHICCGNFDQAALLLTKILDLSEAMRRPLDKMEALILLAISFWKKKRGYQKKALECLENAILLAQTYGYEQLFINEGAELESMLSHLKSRAVRSDYEGEMTGTFVKKLYMGVSRQALHSRGLTGGRVEQAVQFTQQQKKVMQLLCEGYSYRKIGEELGIRFSTVRSHIELIYRKLDVSGAKEAVFKIRELNVLEDELP